MRTVGLLGAVDPIYYQQYRTTDLSTSKTETKTLKPDHFNDSNIDTTVEYNDIININVHEKRMTKIEKYYFNVVISELKDILMDPSLFSHHQTVLAIATRVIKQVGYQAYPYIHDYMRGLIIRLNEPDTTSLMKEYILEHIAILIKVIGNQMHYYTTSLITVIQEFYTSHLTQCIDLLEACYDTFTIPQYHIVLYNVLPILLKLVNDEISDERKKERGSDSNYNNNNSYNNINSSNSIDIYDNNNNNTTTGNTTSSTTSRNTILKLGSGGGNSGGKYPLKLPRTLKLYQCLINIKAKLGDYRIIILDMVITTIIDVNISSYTRKYAIGVMISLTEDIVYISYYANRFVHPLIRVLSTISHTDTLLLSATITALSTFICRLGYNYLPFVLSVKRVWPIHAIPHTKRKETRLPCIDEYDMLIVKLLRQRPLPLYPSDYHDLVVSKTLKNTTTNIGIINNNNTDSLVQIHMQTLENAWTISNIISPSPLDLSDWLQRFSTEFIRQAPNAYIRLCTPLVKANRASAEQLLNASFHCIWESLYYGDSTDVLDDISLISTIEIALSSSNVPRDVVVCLLNVCEFMDMQDKRLPIDVTILAKQAEDANMFARCLRYREIEFNSMNTIPSDDCVESLITVNHELGLVDKATGVLLYVASNCPQIIVKPLWLEKLLYWNDAKDSYRKLKHEYRRESASLAATATGGGTRKSHIYKHDNWLASELGEMRCLHALGEYDELASSAKEFKDDLKKHESTDGGTNIQTWLYDVNILGASAAWSLGKWDLMSDFIEDHSISM